MDPVGMSVQLSPEDLQSVLDVQAHEMSPKTVEKIKGEIKKGKTVSGSSLGLGGVPPTLDALGGVACSRIVRSHVLSFAALRQMRFGAGPEGDAACRALLAAFALNGLARADAELNLRANCNLVEAGPSSVKLDLRHGQVRELKPLSIEAADRLLQDAIEQAEKRADIRWVGQVLHVTGHPKVSQGAVEEGDG